MVYVLFAVGLLAVVALSLWWSSPNKGFIRTDGKRKAKVPLYRPVKRYKSKIRGIGIAPKKKMEDLGVVTREDGRREQRYFGVDRKHYVRFYPNFGFTLFGRHWCRKGNHGSVR